MQPLQ